MVHEKCSKGLPPLKRTKLSKNNEKGRMKLKKNYMKLISGGMIVNSDCVGTNLNGWILNITPKEINPILFLQKCFTLIKMTDQIIFV